MKSTPLLALCLVTAASAASAEQAAQTEPSTEPLVSSTRDWAGATLPAFPAEGQPELTAVRVTIPPGTQLPVHKHPVYNLVYVEQGELTLVLPDQDENNILKVPAGEAFVEVMDKWHFGRNDGDVPTVLVLFYAGIEGTPITIFQEDQ